MGAVLITGGAGYIGSHAAWAVLDAGLEAVVLDDLSSGLRESVPPGARFVQGDVADRGLLRRLLREARVDAVLHFAGRAVAPESMRRPLDHYAVNTGGVAALLSACVDAGVDRFVLSSTAAVYGDATTRADEDAPTRPVSPYGRSKLMAEAVLADAAQAHGLRATALRYFNVAGADPAGRAGQSTTGATHLFKAACEAALGVRPALTVFGEDWPTRDGTGVRDFVHVTDLVHAHLLAMSRLAGAAPGAFDVLNLGSERGCSVREVARAVGGAAGRPVPLLSAPRRPGDMGELVADATRADAVLGWRATSDVDLIAAHALAWETRRLGGMRGAPALVGG